MSVVVGTSPRLYTQEDLWRLSQEGHRYELIEGRLQEMAPAGSEHGRSTKRLDHYLTDHIYAHDLGECFAAETGFTLARAPDTTLASDWEFVRKDRLPASIPDGYLPVVPDLVIETRSPGDRRAKIEDKIRRWLAHGVPVVLDLAPRHQKLRLWRAGAEPVSLSIEDDLTLNELPGFSLPLWRVFG